MTFRGSDHPDELLSASVSGDLSPEEQARLDRHKAECARCRDELDAFAADRRALGSMQTPPAPRDLQARVRAGIEQPASRRGWFVGLAASVATVVAAIALVALLGRLPNQPGSSPSPAPSESAVASPSVVEQTPGPSLPWGFLAPGDMGYFFLSGDVLNQLEFRNDRTGMEIIVPAPTGAILVAALSPDGQWLAYISQKGESGANELWALNLTRGGPIRLGCSAQFPFTNRLVWSPDSSVLAYTLAAIDLGPAVGCNALETTAGSTDVWLFETNSAAARRLTGSGDAYAAAFVPELNSDPTALLVSHAGDAPWTDLWKLSSDPVEPAAPWADVFMPSFGIDHVLWYVPLLVNEADGRWNLQGGGIPLVGAGSGTNPPTQGTPAISPGFAGSSLTEWHVAWSPDGETFASWSSTVNAILVSTAQEADNGSPGTPTAIDLPVEGAWIVDAVFSPSGKDLLVTVGIPSAGIGDSPSSQLIRLSLPGGFQSVISEGGDNPPWTGPAVFAP